MKRPALFILALMISGLFLNDARGQVKPRGPQVTPQSQLSTGLCTYHCFCKARCGSGPVGTEISDAILDWGAIKTYHNYCLNKEKNSDDCASACSQTAINDPRWSNASFLCANCPSGTVTAYAGVADKEYKTAQTRVIVNTPAVTQTLCSCPAGWLANSTNQDGGISSDGKCKKVWCFNTVIPPPPDDTPIGTWGFTWGNAVWVWGSAANGGEARSCITIITTPAVCVITQ